MLEVYYKTEASPRMRKVTCTEIRFIGKQIILIRPTDQILLEQGEVYIIRKA